MAGLAAGLAAGDDLGGGVVDLRSWGAALAHVLAAAGLVAVGDHGRAAGGWGAAGGRGAARDDGGAA